MATTSLSLFDLRPEKVLLDRYEIQRPHRETGITSTFAVEYTEDGQRLEMQVYPAGLFEGREQAAEFAARLEAWCGFEVEGLLRTRSVHVFDDGAVILLTDFPPGQSLRGWMNENPRMEEHEVVDLASTLLTGLARVHDAGLVHGDVKPASIYFRPGTGEGTLVDAGVTPGLWSAKHLGTRTALIGTPFYAPIEQFTGDSPDELSDLYNLSTVMYELLTGVLPWSGKGYIEVFQSKMQKTPPKMSVRAPGLDVNPALEAVVAGGLFAERAKRHPSAATYLERLQAVDLDE